jgi:energy-coupling factor transport system ATP-binding protein
MTLDIAGLSFAYPGRPKLFDGVSLPVEPGARIAILGGNGTGKSTLARLIAGLETPSAADAIRWNARPWRGYALADRVKIAQYVGQRPLLQLSGRAATLREEIAFGLENLRVDPAVIAAKTDAILARFGLAELSARDPRTLSGGQMQRLSIAASLVLEPELLVLDEPMTDLDAESRDDLKTYLRKLPNDAAILFVDVAAQDWMNGLVERYYVLDGAALTGHFTREDLPRDPLQSPTLPKPGGEVLVGLSDVAFAYPGQAPVFEAAGFDLAAGEVIAAVGRNGAGKSTLLRLLCGLETPAAGTVRVDGLDPAQADPVEFAKRIGVVFQNSDRYFVKPRVLDEAALGLHLQGAADADAKARALLDLVGLGDTADRHPQDLDAGQRRVVATVAALAHEPKLVLLDEVQRGLDRTNVARVERLIARARDGGACVLLVSHDADFVARNATRILRVGDGKAELSRTGI